MFYLGYSPLNSLSLIADNRTIHPIINTICPESLPAVFNNIITNIWTKAITVRANIKSKTHQRL